ncbi:LysR substrate binding domain protein [Pseudovibrio sp. Ad14]|nr:LysR substrate binding domain protein [Pseudovibrio sp. Ad14]
MVRSQIGITILPDTTTQMLNTDEINFIPLPDTSIQREIQIIRKSETPPSPAAQALEQTILTFVQDNK